MNICVIRTACCGGGGLKPVRAIYEHAQLISLLLCAYRHDTADPKWTMADPHRPQELNNPASGRSTPKSISRHSHNRNGSNYSKSAPEGRDVESEDSGENQPLLSRSLVEPVIEESDVLNSSQSSSMLQLRREAAGGALGRLSPESSLERSNLDHEWEFIAQRNERKREIHGTSDFQTFMHMLKGNIGTGLLALPYVVSHAGLLFGCIGMLVMSIIAVHCMGVLVETSHRLCKVKKVKTLNYAEVAQAAVLVNTNTKHGLWISRIVAGAVNGFLMVTQFGFCCIYFVFIADSLSQVACFAFGFYLGPKIWILIILPFVVIFSWIRNLDDLTPFSMMGNLCIVFSLFVITYEEIYLFASNDPREMAAIRQGNVSLGPQSASGIALYFGGVIFSFEGIGVLLPLENKMKNPKHAMRVVYISMVIITTLFISFAGLGYLAYGDDVKSSLTLNLTSDRLGPFILFLIVKLYYAYAIFASYTVQFYVPLDFLEPPLYQKLRLDYLVYRFPRFHNKIILLIQIAFRTTLVVITAGIALAIPHLGALITLLGAVASSALALIFPPILDILTFWNDKRERKWLGIFPFPVWFTKDILILLFGLLGAIFGTVTSIMTIVQAFEKPTPPPPICYPNYSI